LDVCDKVNENPEDGAKLIVDLIIKRLSLRDANVQLRTLSLLTSIAENCGSRVCQEIASKSFTNVLLNKIKDPLIHKEIKIKIVQVLTQLSNSFSNDPSLRPIQDAFNEISNNYSQFFPPDKPQKNDLNDDALKEEEDLKAAIALSLSENNQTSVPTNVAIQQQQQPAQQQQQQQQQESQISIPKKSFSRVRALYDSFSTDPADLHFRKGDIITVLDRVYKDWGKGSLRGIIGLFPFNYVTPLYEPTSEELLKESLKEVEILNQSKKIEKMLTLLSSSTSSSNYEILDSNEFQRLYQEIILIKPEISELIEKYRIRKDELLDLHVKLKDATIKYEELTDPLKKSQQQQQQQQQQQESLGYGYQQPQPQGYQQPHGYQQPQTGLNYHPSTFPQQGQGQSTPTIPTMSTIPYENRIDGSNGSNGSNGNRPNINSISSSQFIPHQSPNMPGYNENGRPYPY